MVIADCPQAASIVGVYMSATCAMPCRMCSVGLSASHDKISSVRNPQRIYELSRDAANNLLSSLGSSACIVTVFM